VIMERPTTVHCDLCHRPINSGEGFVCSKVPGNETYQFFHCRFRIGDCWEVSLQGAQVKFLAHGSRLSHHAGTRFDTSEIPPAPEKECIQS
jgi:hypothetical protein